MRISAGPLRLGLVAAWGVSNWQNFLTRRPHCLTVAFLTAFVFTGAKVASADAIQDLSQFLTQAQGQMQTTASGYYSWASVIATGQTEGTTTVDGFAGSFTTGPAVKQVTLSTSYELWCVPDAPSSCISNGPSWPFTDVTEGYATGSAAAAAHAQIGSLGAQASTGGDAFWATVSGAAGSAAGMWDTISISPSRSYSGFLQVNATVQGQLAVTEDNNLPAHYNFVPGVDAAVGVTYGTAFGQLGAFATTIGFDSQGNTFTYIPYGVDLRNGIPISFDVPYSPSGYNPSTGLYSYAPDWFYVQLSAAANCSVGGAEGDSSMCAADSDYQDTLRVTGLEVLDSNGNPVPGATLSAASGFDYNGRSSVPEPGTFVLLATLVAGAVLVHAARKHNDRSRLVPF